MRDHEQGARPRRQPLLEPDHGIQIQVIRRLVEQHQIGAAHECARQIETDAESARERGHGPLEFVGAKAQAIEHHGGACLGGPASEFLVMLVRRSHALAIAGMLGRFDAGLGGTQLEVAVQHVLDRRPVASLHLLLHPRDEPGCRHLDVPRIGVKFAAEHREKRGLSTAVGTDHAELLAGVDHEGGVLQQELFSPPEGDVAQTDHVGAREKRKARIVARSRDAVPLCYNATQFLLLAVRLLVPVPLSVRSLPGLPG